MKKKIGAILFFSILGLSFASTALAQFGQTGSLNGTVTDAEGAALPGVGVTLKSPALILV
jgi:hypothetical protein